MEDIEAAWKEEAGACNFPFFFFLILPPISQIHLPPMWFPWFLRSPSRAQNFDFRCNSLSNVQSLCANDDEEFSTSPKPPHNPLLRRVAIMSDGQKIWVGVRYERLPIFCFCCGRMGHQSKECTDEAAKEISTVHVQFGLWLHASTLKRCLKSTKLACEPEKTWLKSLKEANVSNAFVGLKEDNSNEEQKPTNLDNFETPPNSTTDFCKARVKDPIYSDSVLFSLVGLSTTQNNFMDFGSEDQQHNVDWAYEVAQFNTPTAHALRAWAWSSGRLGGFGGFGGFGLSWRRVICSLMSFLHLYFFAGVFLDAVCFEVMRWISVWPLDSDESDRDLPPQSLSESIDPSVDGCTPKQRSLKGGWTETLYATGEILSLWGKDDYLIFLVLYLYYDMYCNRNIFF